MSERTISDKQIDDIVDVLNKIQDNYPTSIYEDKIIPSVIQYMEDQYINFENAGYILSRSCDVKAHEKTLQGVYERTIPPFPFKSTLQKELSAKDRDDLKKAVEPRRHDGTLNYRIDNSSYYTINFKTKKIYLIKEAAKGDDNAILVLDCVPKKVVVYDTKLIDQPRRFKVTWESMLSSRGFTTQGESNGASIKEMEEYLVNTGYSPTPRHVSGAISATMNSFIMEDLAIIQEDIDNEGFYYDVENDTIQAIRKTVREPSEKELTEALKVLEDLVKYFKGNEEILASVIKWGLMSCFSYAKKQIGNWMPWLYLKGAAKSGKTTLGNIVLYLWGEPTDENRIGGGGFNTQARVGLKLSKDCNPLLVNEPAGVFNRESVVEVIKHSIESTVCRGKSFGGSYMNVPAFAPVIFTANQYLPADDALLRRFYVLSFSYSMRKTDEEKKEFENKFRIGAPNSPLKKLHALTDFITWEMLLNPDYIIEDWQTVVDLFIKKMYIDIDKTVPEWLLSWAESETLEDFDNSSIEDIRLFFINAFNQAKQKVQLRDENGYITSHDVTENGDSSDFEDINWQIVNNRLLPWAIPHISRNNTRYICLTRGLKKDLADNTSYCDDLKSIGELLGWPYKSVRLDKVQKVLKINFETFLDFMYPKLTFDDEEEVVT